MTGSLATSVLTSSWLSFSQRYLNDFYILAKERGWKYYYFSGFDTPYKAEQAQDPETVEEYFGLFGADGVLKTAYADLKFTKMESASSSDDETGSIGTNEYCSPLTKRAGLPDQKKQTD